MQQTQFLELAQEVHVICSLNWRNNLCNVCLEQWKLKWRAYALYILGNDSYPLFNLC